MALVQTVHLSMANFKSAPVVPAVQNDTDRQVKMIIDDYTLTSGLTGKIAFERSDGTHYEAAAELVLADNAFIADIDQALTQPGRTMVQLKVTDTLTVSTFSFVIFVEADNSGTVTPQEGIDLVTAVADAEAAATRAESAAEDVGDLVDLPDAIAPEFSTSAAYAVGDYIMYNGHLYRFTASHSAGAWNSADAVSVNVGDEIGDLKNALDTDVQTKYLCQNYLKFVPGNFNPTNGTIVSHTKYNTAIFVNNLGRGTITINLADYKLCTFSRPIGSSDSWTQTSWAVTQNLQKGYEYYVVSRENSQIDINQYANLISKSITMVFDSSLIEETKELIEFVDTADTIQLTGTNEIKADTKSVCSFSVDTLTVPPATTINTNPYIGEFFYTLDIQKLLGKTVRIRVSYTASSDIESYLFANMITNVSGVVAIEKSINYEDNYVELVVYIPSNASLTASKYIIAAITVDTVSATSFNANQTVQITGVSVSDYYLDDIIATNISDAVSIKHQFTDAVYVAVSNGATKTTDASTGWDSLTIPIGETGRNSMIGVKVDKKSNLVLGKDFYVQMALSTTADIFNFSVSSNSASSGSVSLLWHIADAKGNHLFKVHCNDVDTLTWLIVVAQVNSTTARTSAIEVKVKSYSLLSEEVGIEQVAAMYFNHDYGKKLCAFGHSMTQMEYWQNTILTDLGLDSYSNVAIYGGTLVANYAGISNTPADADIVTVWYDTNDWALSQTLGSITDDSSTPTTFYGALKYVCDWLGTNRPYAKVLLISSPKRFDDKFETLDEHGYQENNNGDTLEDFSNAIGEVADLYSYGFADLFHKSGINDGNKSVWLANDLLHPNVPCGIKLGHIISEAIRAI